MSFRSSGLGRPLPPLIRRIGVAAAGGTLLAAGVAMLVLPGPGLLVMVAGLGLLATEFAWAERRLAQTKQAARRTAGAVRSPRLGRRRSDTAGA